MSRIPPPPPHPDDPPVFDVAGTSSTDTYTVSGTCGNCGARFVVRQRRRLRVPAWATCPNCLIDVTGWKR